MDHMDYPIYRKMRDASNYYRIVSPDRFVELQRIGERWVMHHVVATMYPEKVRVMEMVGMDDGRYELLDEAEWNKIETLVEEGQVNRS